MATGNTVSRSDVEDAAAVARTVGASIRTLRTDQGLRLKDLAEATGLKQPFLSQLERGLAAPSMHSLYRLARALGVTPGDLLPTPEPPPGATVIRAGEGRRVPSADSELGFVRLLLTDPRYPFELSEIDVDESQNNDEWFDNLDGAATYVVHGRLDVELGDINEKYTLNPGDTLVYAARSRSRWTAVGATRVLHVVARV